MVSQGRKAFQAARSLFGGTALASGTMFSSQSTQSCVFKLENGLEVPLRPM
jgi:hypothetical protein